ncbi:methylenetetrahydrofolate reductase [Polluticaenibacter yanchengensis]|uniref:Methylenetetrahydrofolate reductase n=1 Tax=Polluticaenibacter yanchengensis TaxID=3014562 RepID=A0ABT4UPC0_9BACT|nr:methylenetetrahydrofolate reductase [Chitinophagaceae bacterium LY-5]
MKVTEHIEKAGGKPLISFEILPPLKGKSIQSLHKHLDPLMEFKPPFINVTYHRAETMYKKKQDGSFQQIEVRKRPGTVAICAALRSHYNVDTVPHLICGGFSKHETESALIDLNYLGINNVLALQGDAAKSDTTFEPHPQGHRNAIDLLKQVKDMNLGLYLDDEVQNDNKSDFCVGVAGYPEKHFESPNPEIDMQHLKAKVDAGADYIMTQMFFDNEKYFDFVKRCREAGITVPIIPGLKPLTTRKQLSVLPRIFHIDIPTELSLEVMKCKNDGDVEAIGEAWLKQQSKELIDFGVPVLHYYTLGKPLLIKRVISQLV